MPSWCSGSSGFSPTPVHFPETDVGTGMIVTVSSLLLRHGKVFICPLNWTCVVAHALNPSTPDTKAGQFCESETSLLVTVSSRSAKVI